MGFLMTLPRCFLPEQIWAWGRSRFTRFRVANTSEVTLVAGLGFKNTPKSLKHFQRLMNINLINWGFERQNQYQHGWLKFCSLKDFCKAFRNPVVSARWPRIRKKIDEKPALSEAERLRERRRVLNGGPLNPRRESLGGCMAAKDAFDVLAALLDEKREARKAKRAQFNRERYGAEVVPRAIYSNKELDVCQTWQEVARRRGPPRSYGEMHERKVLDNICQQQVASARCCKPVGM